MSTSHLRTMLLSLLEAELGMYPHMATLYFSYLCLLTNSAVTVAMQDPFQEQ